VSNDGFPFFYFIQLTKLILEDKKERNKQTLKQK